MDCKLYVSTCHICNRYKKPLKRAKAELGRYHSGVPFERIHLDILGPLPVTQQNNKYVLVIIDQFTKWLECCPLPNQNAEVVAKALMDSTISRFGCPMELHTDQGKNVDGRVIRQLCDLLEVSKTRTSAYHPASNGQVERYNRIITQLIRCFLKKNQNRWDIHLQQLAGAIRATENRQTGFTPNFMVFGREVNQPIDLVLGQIKERFPDQDICKYVQSLRNSLKDAHDIARDNLKSAQKRQKQDYDLNLNFRKYCVGDIVLKLDTARKVGISPKLKAPWKGPYVVIEVKSPALLKIKDRKREEVVHHDRLKLCIDREIPLWLQRLRNDILGRAENKLERDTNMELEDLYLDILFSGENQNTQNGLNPLSESLTDDLDNNDPFLVSDSLTNNYNNEQIIIKDLHSLIDIPSDLDATLAYDLSQNSLLPNSDDINRDTDKLDNGSKQGQVGRRKRQMPSYLHDYVQ
ncbi:Hypothetical predicted protein [Mytilus galloprovincialis]|uniref:Integrase catalytic domain-containing protein n=1 Tax=Mytilus galloprovincialis TaxID=29158 RepID=A0A8B6D0A6_MYTGA|nr:Hypothetical predicted protein [Mytilus galloprovincialis]